MKFDQPFDPTQHEPTGNFEPIPAGWYAVRILTTEKRPTKAGTGEFLQLELQVDAAHHPDIGERRLWDRLNLWNPNASAVDIANRTLSAICYALDIKNLEDTDQLCGKLLAAKVVIRDKTEQYDATNEVKVYDALTNRISGAPKAGSAAAPAQTSTPKQENAPWRR